MPNFKLTSDTRCVRAVYAIERDEYPKLVEGGVRAGLEEHASFGILLRHYRTAAGLSQEALAERARLSRRGIADLERGARRFPFGETVRRLADALALHKSARDALFRAARPHSEFSDTPGRRPQVWSADSLGAMRGSAAAQIVLTGFVGRAREIYKLKQLIGTARLITLVGTGGIGKTRLAMRVVSELPEANEGRLFIVELAAVSDDRLIDQSVLAAIGGRELPHRSVRDAVVAKLQTAEYLLVLDNCEHLAFGCAELVADLLQSCPRLRILATSREVLGVPGETLWRVPTLSIPGRNEHPTLEDARRYEAVQLFTDRARRVNPDFELTLANVDVVSRICRRLDGIPLAIEIAAARTRLLGVRDIDERLDQRFEVLVDGGRITPERHQTLRATLDWSYDLLTEDEQFLLQRLSVFAGSATLRAIESVCGNLPSGRVAVLDVLARLVDRSLVLVEDRDGNARFRLLETIRAYAGERLPNSEKADLARRHRDWYLSVAEASQPGLLDPRQVAHLDEDYDDLRAALRWCIDAGEVEPGLRLSIGLWLFWYVRGLYIEGGAWFATLLAASASNPATASRATAMHCAAHLAANGGEPERALEMLAASAKLCREIGDQRELAIGALLTGIVLRNIGDGLGAREQFENALEWLDPVKDWMWRVVALCSFGHALCEEGHYAHGESLATEALSIARVHGHTWGIARAQYDLGRVAAARGDCAAANQLLQNALLAHRELGYPQGIVWCLLALAPVHAALGDPAGACNRLTESLGLAHKSGDLLAVAQSLEGLAEVLAVHAPSESVRAAAAASVIRESLSAEPAIPSRARLDAQLEIARMEVGDIAWRELWSSGRRLTVEDLISSISSIHLPDTAAVSS